MKPRFVYSSYWHKWSLLLTDKCNAKPGTGPYVEIDLEPVNGWDFKPYVANVLAINVRRHGTSRAAKDKIAYVLPPDVELEARENFGNELFDWLISTDILAKIDWLRHRQHNNGGASLRLIVHDRYLDDIPGSRLDA